MTKTASIDTLESVSEVERPGITRSEGVSSLVTVK